MYSGHFCVFFKSSLSVRLRLLWHFITFVLSAGGIVHLQPNSSYLFLAQKPILQSFQVGSLYYSVISPSDSPEFTPPPVASARLRRHRLSSLRSPVTVSGWSPIDTFPKAYGRFCVLVLSAGSANGCLCLDSRTLAAGLTLLFFCSGCLLLTPPLICYLGDPSPG